MKPIGFVVSAPFKDGAYQCAEISFFDMAREDAQRKVAIELRLIGRTSEWFSVTAQCSADNSEDLAEAVALLRKIERRVRLRHLLWNASRENLPKLLQALRAVADECVIDPRLPWGERCVRLADVTPSEYRRFGLRLSGQSSYWATVLAKDEQDAIRQLAAKAAQYLTQGELKEEIRAALLTWLQNPNAEIDEWGESPDARTAEEKLGLVCDQSQVA